jgi:hypothetical protein
MTLDRSVILKFSELFCSPIQNKESYIDYSVSVHVVLKLGSRNMFVIIIIIAICELLIDWDD